MVSGSHIRQTAIVTIVRHRCHSFLPHFAVPFQKMLPPFNNVDLFLNITSTPATNINFVLPFLRPAHFYLSRHFNHLYAFHAIHEPESETGERQNKNEKNDSLKWMTKIRNGNVMRLFFIHGQNGRRQNETHQTYHKHTEKWYSWSCIKVVRINGCIEHTSWCNNAQPSQEVLRTFRIFLEKMWRLISSTTGIFVRTKPRPFCRQPFAGR